MKAETGELAEVVVIEPKVHEDDRGFFYESWNDRVFTDLTGVQTNFVQDNHSGSQRSVLRGLHYQLPPAAQGKLVRVVVGSVYDVAVDIRQGAATFGKWLGVELSADNRKQLWVPPGFAHGFVTLSEWAEVLYKTTSHYAADLDRSIRWNDPEIGIEWPIDAEPVLSSKDREAPFLQDAEVFS